MQANHTGSKSDQFVHKLKHYLPSQAPLKDFVHHNTLHAFQDKSFHQGLRSAAETFGYKVYQPLNAYRDMYKAGKIATIALEQTIERKHASDSHRWLQKLINHPYDENITPQIGLLREEWKQRYKLNMDKRVHPILFRLIGHYLDQGIAFHPFPESENGFLTSIKNIDTISYKGIFKSKRVKALIANTNLTLDMLLDLVVGPTRLHERYLFDQQFAHPGWSGMVSFLEDNPSSLFDSRSISLVDFMCVELLLEIDFLDQKFEQNWKPIGHNCEADFTDLFVQTEDSELFEILSIWQDAYEWTYYNTVLLGLQKGKISDIPPTIPSFQSLFCIDDRTAAFRKHLETAAPDCATYGTAGFFNAEFYFEPEFGKFYTKVCPAPVSPKYLILEKESTKRHRKDAHFSKQSQSFFAGWLLSQTMGFWSALKMSANIFMPTESKASVSSFKHMDPNGKLSIEHHKDHHRNDGLQVGFTVQEMAHRVEQMFRSIGLIDNFSELIYIVGHGASSTNNTHYAGYDCGACSGRPGSVNARAMAHMANHGEVRKLLAEKGLMLPDSTLVVGGLHDTTKDEIEFYDLKKLSATQKVLFDKHLKQFNQALTLNAKERAINFMLIDDQQAPEKVHKQVKLRALSLFEPRPEWNHASNALCVVGRRETQQHFSFDRRAFLNSYNYQLDMEGNYLLGILNAVAPVCGGINLEYYFSKNDNSRLGAGSKLPHNVMGLIGVANGMDGDLRPGLPLQMVNIHEAVRLMVIVEHFPEVVLKTIAKNPSTLEWFENEWVRLAVIKPDDHSIYIYEDGKMSLYDLLDKAQSKTQVLQSA